MYLISYNYILKRESVFWYKKMKYVKLKMSQNVTKCYVFVYACYVFLNEKRNV